MQDRPITAFVLTALVLWMVYLWRAGRLGKPGLLPHPADAAPSPSATPPVLPQVPGTPGAPTGWQQGTPQVTP